MTEFTDLAKERIVPIMIAVAVMVLVSWFYLPSGNANAGMGGGGFNVSPAFYRNLQLKVAFSSEGTIKLFAETNPSMLSGLPVSSGTAKPSPGSMVVGSDEAMMMKKEKLFSDVGDTIDGLYGLDVRVGGILEKTSSAVDRMHFLSSVDFTTLKADPESAFIRFSPDGAPKLFLRYDPQSADAPNLKLDLREGTISHYRTFFDPSTQQLYYPLILGSKEAAMMREEKIFSKAGDRIDGFFGTHVIVSGVLYETGTALDYMHITPLGGPNLN